VERALEPAARVFAGELERATQSYRHGGADCLLLPSGAAITLVYLVGAVTALSGDTRTAMTARVADPTGVFLVRATSREPETLTALAAVTPPAFLAVLGYAVGGRNGPSVHPVSVAPVDRGTRDRWLLRTADLTAARLDAVLARLRGDGDDPIIDAAIAASPLLAKYATAIERESALEMLGKQTAARTEAEKAAQVEAENAKVREAAAAAAEKERLAAEKQAAKDAAAAQKAADREAAAEAKRQANEPGMVESVVKSSAFKSMLRSAGTVLGREITRSIFGTSRRR